MQIALTCCSFKKEFSEAWPASVTQPIKEHPGVEVETSIQTRDKPDSILFPLFLCFSYLISNVNFVGELCHALFSFFKFKLCMCMQRCTGLIQVRSDARSTQRQWIPWSRSHLRWELGTQLKSSIKRVNVLNHWSISLAPLLLLLISALREQAQESIRKNRWHCDSKQATYS